MPDLIAVSTFTLDSDPGVLVFYHAFDQDSLLGDPVRRESIIEIIAEGATACTDKVVGRSDTADIGFYRLRNRTCRRVVLFGVKTETPAAHGRRHHSILRVWQPPKCNRSLLLEDSSLSGIVTVHLFKVAV